MTVGLSPDQLASFEANGFLAIPDVLSDADLAPVEEEYEQVLDRAAHDLAAAGKISEPFAGLGFEERYFAVLEEYPDLYKYLSISLPLLNDEKDPEAYRCHTGPALFSLLRNDKILDVVESVIGGEISANPIQQIRMKPPLARVPKQIKGYSNIGSTTWHQDHGAAMDDAFDTEMLTVWLAMTDATKEMGCLVAAPTSHRGGQLTLHCPGRNIGVAAENYIPLGIIESHETQPIPVSKGSVIILSKWTEHASLDNVSDSLRWSFDLRYQVTGQPSGRPAFPSFVARSRGDQNTVMTDPAAYAKQWDDARAAILNGSYSGVVFEQDRWAKNATDPLCA